MDVSTLEWTITLSVTIGVILFDVVMIARVPHEPSMKECGIAFAIYTTGALVFGLWTALFHGHQYGVEFLTGFLIEKSLSVDNLFVFIVLMAALNVPRKYQQEALMVGIILALILRGVFIAAGYQLINLFSWVFYVFGAFLIWTAWRLVRSHMSGQEEHPEENRIVRFAQEHLNVGTEWRGLTLWWKENGTRVFSPMIIVIIALGVTDVLFALDSIPAIFGVTQEPYLVFTANVFALMGLRQLYFLIGGLLERLVHLAYGLGFLLAFIGVKLVFHALHENELPFINGGEPLDYDWLEIPIWLSLLVIIGTLVVTAVTSLAATRLKDDENAPSGAGGSQD
jgi:tellurite resistance protein TerC